MQSMDRNTVIGFVLLAILLFAYLFISTKNSRELEVQKKRYDDSVAAIIAKKEAIIAKKDTAVTIPVKDTSSVGKLLGGHENTITVESEVLKIVFSNKGGQPKSVQLKKYKSVAGDAVELENSNTDKLSYPVNIAVNQSAQSSDLFFNDGHVEKKADGSQVVTFQLNIGDGAEKITHQYIIKPDNYLLDWNVQFTGADKLLTQNAFNLQWQIRSVQHEKYAKYERQQSQIVYLQEDGYDYNNIISKTEKKFDKPVQWVSVKQQFFNATLIAKNRFDGGQIQWTHNTEDTTGLITEAISNFNTKLPAGGVANVPMQLNYGPNDYKILKNNGVEKMDKIINLGQGIYSFVRPINQFIIMPVFNFFKSFFNSYGLVIALLTIFIRLITSPLVYTSYLSGAKMKALRPELDLLKKKFPDQQQYGVEQMKLFREVGVNPLGGCIPALLQIPIFFALYSLFNSSIALRGENFLWARDLSTFDVIAKLPFSIPGYGDHVSLFTITAVATSFLISVYNMNMTPDQNNPALKYMPYIFPFVLLFVFNSLPAALTWYYTVSNVITLILQWVIQTYIIDHAKILAKLEENKKKPKSKSKWQERLEQMQETQKRVQDLKNKPKGK
jgi:YidC/Oxa1 family membrane protein insertase